MPASATIEERVTNLEHEVRYLKAFAGPGQNEAFSQNVAEIRTMVVDLQKQTGRLEMRMGTVETRLDQVDSRLDGIDTRLEQVGTQLTDVNQLLQEHAHLLGEVLRRLPKQADPANN